MPGFVFQSGDLLEFAGRGFTSRVIQIGTCSRASHVGGIAYVDRWLAGRLSDELDYLRPHVEQGWRDRYLLIESTTLNSTPCVLTGKTIKGVQAHDPNQRINDYDGRVWLYRLWPQWKLTVAESNALSTYLLRMIGVPYGELDAAEAGGNILKWLLPKHTTWDITFCSKLWCGALERINRNEIKNCAKVHPGGLLRGLVDVGVYYLHQQIKPLQQWRTPDLMANYHGARRRLK